MRCIIHLTNTTRLKVAYTTGFICRSMSDEGFAHLKAAKYVLGDLKGTRNHWHCVYGCQDSTENVVRGYSDCDFIGEDDMRL